VLTHDSARSIEKKSRQKLRLVSGAEATALMEAEKEALLDNMPEDAVMINDLGDGSSKINYSHYLSDVTSVSDLSSSEIVHSAVISINERASGEATNSDFQNEPQPGAKTAKVSLIDPEVLKQYTSREARAKIDDKDTSFQQKSMSTTSRVPMRTHLPPIFERSFEQSEIGSMQAAAESNAANNRLSFAMTPRSDHVINPGDAPAAVFSPYQPLLSSADASWPAPPNSLILSKDEEKWPVQKQTVIVVTRTYQEQQARHRRRIVIASLILLVVLAWLIWMLFVTLS